MRGLDHRSGAGRRGARRGDCGRGNAGGNCGIAGESYGALSEDVAEEMKRTANAQRLTPDAQWKRGTGVAALLIVACSAFGEVSRLEEAAGPMDEGVPQVAVLRL